uniref:Inhibin beta chain n=3 Tax=Zeugodacus cucurbitae TaxID=28588 RepID=A0A0A1WD14_ZEUCU
MHLKSPVSLELSPNRPFLVLRTETRILRRVRRRAIDCVGAMHGQCCKESFYVSFKALGWDDWIIAPRGYFANYCRGDCSGPFRTPDTFQTFHAHFIEEYRKMGLLNGMQPCCAPVKFSSMSLIYYGDDGIIKRDLPKMVVDECGCP